MKHHLVKNCDWPFKTEQIIIKLAVTDDELVQSIGCGRVMQDLSS